ncbi:MAG TPA: hypothetical protein DCM05_03580 [Elusimicrobia bacterium]|nr:hypothetical protein [Elusimicrobiota bacterium]
MRMLLASALVVLLSGNAFAAYLLQYTITPQDSKMVTGSGVVKEKKALKVTVGDKVFEITPSKQKKDAVKLSVKVVGKDEKGKKKTFAKPIVITKLGTKATLSIENAFSIEITPTIEEKEKKAPKSPK